MASMLNQDAAFRGATQVFAVGVLFRTPPQVLDAAHRAAEEAAKGDDRPIALREEAV